MSGAAGGREGKLLSPDRRRQAVGQHRSTQRRVRARPGQDQALRAQLRAISAAKPRWGYRRAHAQLRGNGWQINRKRVQRLWREEGLRVPQRTRKRRRVGESTAPEGRLKAERPGHVWAFDFQFDQTADGRALKLMNVVDEFTREALVIHVDRGITADQAVTVLEQLVARRGAPEHVRCDNGPEMTAVALADWCERAGTSTRFIDPGAPWQNAWIESFNARVRDEVLNLEQFSCLLEAQVVIEDWRLDFNREHPHSALGMKTPAAFAAAWIPEPTIA